MSDTAYDPRERLLLPIDELAAATAHLSTEQTGAFMLLLMHAWRHDGNLPSDDRALAAITLMTRKAWLNAKPLVMPFFRDGLPSMLAGDPP